MEVIAKVWWTLVRFGFRLLYNEMAFTYDVVSTVVSLGEWRCWQRAALSYLEATPDDALLELAHGTGNLQLDLLEAGYQTILSENWYGLFAPAGTPKEVVARLYAELDKTIHAADIREKLAAQGAEIRENTPEQTAAFLSTEMAKWAKVIKASGAKVD